MNKITTSTSRIHLCGDGITHTVMVGEHETPVSAREGLAAIGRLAGGQRASVRLDITNCRQVDLAARQLFTGEETARVHAAAALLMGLPVSRMRGNIFQGVNQPRSPRHLFTSEGEALQWLTVPPEASQQNEAGP